MRRPANSPPQPGHCDLESTPITAVSAVLLEQLINAYLQGRRLILVFDYDGTLTPFAARPELARLDPKLRGLLARLAATPQLAVGVVSGRDLQYLTTMVGLPGLYYGGTWGLELDLRGNRLIPIDTQAIRPLVQDLITVVTAHLSAYPGAWIETKEFGLTVHYRQASATQAEAVRAKVMTVLEPYATLLQIFQEPQMIEVLPTLGFNKGTALKTIVAHAAKESAYVLYAGDATNDTAALTVAVEMGGIALGIGPNPPAVATHRLSDPHTLVTFLATLSATLASLRASA